MKQFLVATVTVATLVTGLAPAAHAKLDVVVTTPDLAALAKEVGADRVTIAVLAKPTEDPHFVDAKPSFVAKLNRADALLEGGADLEAGWLPALLDGTRNRKIASGAAGRLLGAQGVSMLEIPSALDRAKGDLHAMGNPHYLTDPVNAKIVLRNIAEAFGRLDPGGAAIYQANAAKYSARLDAKLIDWQKTLAPFRGREIVAYHNTWPYFAQRFGLKIETFLEPKPGLPPTPTHLAEVIAKIKSQKIRAIIVEPYQNRRTADTVAAQTGAKVVAFTQYPGGVRGTEAGYLELMDYLVTTLAKALEEHP